MGYSMDESDFDVLRADFDRRLNLEFNGSKVTSDAGWFAGDEDVNDAERLWCAPAMCWTEVDPVCETV